MTLRAEMFKSLLSSLVQPGTSPRYRVAALRLFEQNFHEQFNGRALFDSLEQDAKALKQDGVLRDLESLAKDVARQQEGIVEAEAREEFPTLSMEEGSKKEITIGDHEAEITLHSVQPGRVQVKLTIGGKPQNRGMPFEVSYFDAPFTDNTLLRDGHRLALILKYTDNNVHPHIAELKMLEFPEDFVLAGSRQSLRFMELVQNGQQGGH
jgi:hypothetical protein